jgi:hypothetical protein
MEHPYNISIGVGLVTHIVMQDASTYEVSLLQPNGLSQKFEFQVDRKHGIDVVVWADEFSQLLKYNTNSARALFEAILELHGKTSKLPKNFIEK